jgi:aconitate hydratase
VLNLAGWQPQWRAPFDALLPGRVVMQDFTGVPVVVDLAAMRSALAAWAATPDKINPVVPVDLVIDHSVQVDYYGTPDSLRKNAELEFERNRERYEFLHWAQKAFRQPARGPAGHRHRPPGQPGIPGQCGADQRRRRQCAYPDTLVGTDSHTTMINGLGVVGWGVGGIEAISVMVGEPIEMLVPDVIGFKLTGRCPKAPPPPT